MDQKPAIKISFGDFEDSQAFCEQLEQCEVEQTMMIEKEMEMDSMIKMQQKEISKLKNIQDQYKQELLRSEANQRRMLNWQRETTSMLQRQNQLVFHLKQSLDQSNKQVQEQKRELQHQKTILEAQKNDTIKKDLLMSEQKNDYEVLMADLREVQEKLKTKSDQHDQLLEVMKSKEQAFSILEDQMKEKATLLENAVVEAQNQLLSKDAELEEERSRHAKKKPLCQRIRLWFIRKFKK